MPSLARRLRKQLPNTLEEFIEKGEKVVETAEELLKKAPQSVIDDVSLPVNKAAVLAPMVHPPKIICLGLNYADHIDESITEHGALIQTSQ